MTLRKLTLGEIVAGLGAIALLVALFLPWFSGETGFQALSVVLVLLLVVAALGLALFLTTAFQRSQAYPVAAEVFASVIAPVVAIVVLVRVLTGEDPGAGAWIGLVATALVALGAWGALRAPTRP